MLINFETEFKFLKVAENLKKEMRHSYLSDGRQESVAEHSWRLILMAFRYADKLDRPVDLLKCFKIALVHDLPEAIAGDVPVLDSQTPEAKRKKDEAELKAMHEIKDLGGDSNSSELFDVWMEYENLSSYESKYKKALDKIEAFIQHKEADLKTWEPAEKEMVFQEKWLRVHCAFDSFLARFAEEVMQVSVKKLKDAGEDVDAIRISALAKQAA